MLLLAITCTADTNWLTAKKVLASRVTVASSCRSNCEGLLHSVKTSSPPFPPLNLHWGISLPQCNESRGSMDGIQDLLTLPAFLTRVRTHLGQVTFPGLVCSCPALCSPSKILIGNPKQPQGCLWISLKLLHSIGLYGVCIRGAPLYQEPLKLFFQYVLKTRLWWNKMQCMECTLFYQHITC